MRLPALLTSLLLAALLAGCGSDSSDDNNASAGQAPAQQAADTTVGTFPATVEHAQGTTTVKSAPKRIAVVGLTEHDIVLALGYKPILTTDWYGDQPDAVWPWAHDRLEGTKPIVLKSGDGIDFEGVAKARPDLILGTNAGIKKADYKKLSAIAPTVAGCKGQPAYFCRWDMQTDLVATALGQPEKGRQLVADVKAKFAKVAAEHPEFKGKIATFSQNAFYDGKLYVYPPGLNTEFLELLGFTINPKLKGLSKPGIQVDVSAERLDIIDADVGVFAMEKASDVTNLLKVPTFPGLDMVKGNRVVYTDPILSGAMYFMTPLSLPYVLEKLTPELEKAVAGKAPRKMMGS